MKKYTYKNTLISKKQLKQLLAWSFTKYNSIQACSLADELKYIGFKYASQAGISISIEDLRVPFMKNQMLKTAYQEILNAEKIYLKGKITDVERFQKIIDTWSITSESLKEEVVTFFKNYDPLNSVYIMAFSGARGNLSQVRQLVGMRGLMSDPSGEILQLPIKKNFREGLTITDYLMSGYGARKGIVDTALKTANSGYLTRRLIDVAQDIIIRERDCQTQHSYLITSFENAEQIIGRLLNKPVYANEIQLALKDTQITYDLLSTFKQFKIETIYVRSPLTCNLYRSICQNCYGWDLANENLVDIGEAVGIIAGQSIGEPGTQLTMRTFHTGGIFTSEVRQQIVSSSNGILKFSKLLKTVTLRTNRGEDVLLCKNSGSLVIVPENKSQKLIQLEVLPNTILFAKNNQFIKLGVILGELSNTTKQTRTQIKPILSNFSGEVYMPPLKKNQNFANKNKLLWILAGQVYEAPVNSFLNFYPDYKINKNNFIYRTKFINQNAGFVNKNNTQPKLFERILEIVTNQCTLFNCTLKKIEFNNGLNDNYLLISDQKSYYLNFQFKNSKIQLNSISPHHFGNLISNNYKTQIGGVPYYDQRIRNKSFLSSNFYSYYKRLEFIYNNLDLSEVVFNAWKFNKIPFQPIFSCLLWLPEETYKLNCDKNMLLVENTSFISENFEIIPGLFSKSSGVVFISYKNNLVSEISIKSGLVYKGKNFKNIANKVYYPGELILDNIKILQPSLCQHIIGKADEQLIIRPLDIFEIPKQQKIEKFFRQSEKLKTNLGLQSSIQYLYKSNQKIKTSKSLSLISTILDLGRKTTINEKTNIQIQINKNNLMFLFTENICLSNYIRPQLKYTDISSCLLVEFSQFIDAYTTLGYFENSTEKSLEIVKLKSRYKNNRQILLISNNDCLTIPKSSIPTKSVNDLIVKNINLNGLGKIILDNKKFLTIQKGRPYFFPNCQIQNKIANKSILYKLISEKQLPFSNKNFINRQICLNYFDITKKILTKKRDFSIKSNKSSGFKIELPKMFIRKNGNLYSSPIPIFIKNFSIFSTCKESSLIDDLITKKESSWFKKRRQHYCVFIKNSDLISNSFKHKLKNNLIRVQFFEYPFSKSIGIHSITEDYFEYDINSVFCKNGDFISNGQTLGLLNFEKEITGDIVQGLPRIEELLEARKKRQISKNVSTNQKKGLLIQKTSLDGNFEFRKLGTTIKESEKINPHSLLKVYFNYYGLIKNFFCDRKETLTSYRLFNNHEASYRSFKKVQSLILNSVQSVYNSQGVSIADKHLEVIIKQMTTKVLITHERDTPLLPREVIDLYHIEYINDIILKNNKQTAFYVPLLLGITKAALNNPSFISAASFQETTRVLTKAAIEGRVDWLRGLKENIIIGHLIPAGTGSQNYQHSFFNNFILSSTNLNSSRILEKVEL
jgi:DNA-directed RNA polymerase subunit beta'